MVQLTDPQLVLVARYGGFTNGTGYQGLGLTWAVAVALAESAGRTEATGYNPGPPASYDRGLWQINNYYHPTVTDSQAYDPVGCAQAAYRISHGGVDWDPWTTFDNGAAAARFSRAAAAVAAPPYSGPIPQGHLPGGASNMANAQAIIDAAVAFAVAQIGDPYVYGGTGPNEWDCSGLTQAAYAAAGLSLPRTAAQQFAATPQVDPASPQKGDLVFQYMGADERTDHVGIFEGPDVIYAPSTGNFVRRQAYTIFPGRAVTRPTATALPGTPIYGCQPKPPTPITNNMALVEDPGVPVVNFLPIPATPGGSASGSDFGLRPCVLVEPA